MSSVDKLMDYTHFLRRTLLGEIEMFESNCEDYAKEDAKLVLDTYTALSYTPESLIRMIMAHNERGHEGLKECIAQLCEKK